MFGILSLSIYPYHSGPFSGAHVKNNEKSQGPVYLSGVPQAFPQQDSISLCGFLSWLPDLVVMWVCESVHANLSVNFTGGGLDFQLQWSHFTIRRKPLLFIHVAGSYVHFMEQKKVSTRGKRSTGFRIPIDRGFRISWAIFRIPNLTIPDSTSKKYSQFRNWLGKPTWPPFNCFVQQYGRHFNVLYDN